MNRRNFLKNSVIATAAAPLIAVGASKPTITDSRYGLYKTPESLFTFGEIDDFCNEWGWIHVKEFVPAGWEGHKPPYFWSTYGQGKFIGIDGKEYMTFGTYRSQWIGDVRHSSKNKEEFKKFLKLIAGDYYWKGKREHYYFYDVLISGGAPYDCNWMKEFEPNFKPNEEDLKYHGQPYWKIVLHHMGVSHGKPWGYITDKEV